MPTLTPLQARRFLLRSQMLEGSRLPASAENLAHILERLTLLQVDPISVAGANQEIALASRMEGFRPHLLDDALYKQRIATEYWIKCLCILPASHHRFYAPRRAYYRQYFHRTLTEHEKDIAALKAEIEAKGASTSSELGDKRRTTSWWVGEQRLAARLLEVMWSIGDVVIHHRKGRIRYYDLAERLFPEETPATQQEYERQAMLDLFSATRLFTPAGPTGELWAGVKSFRAHQTKELEAEGIIMPVSITGSKRSHYILAEDAPLLDKVDEPLQEKTVRLLAPLDSMLWDRKLIKEIFDYEVSFEIYKKPEKRAYGYYCLPILWGERLVGRVDLARDKKAGTLNVLSVHWEEGFKRGKRFDAAFEKALESHCEFLFLSCVFK